MTKISRFNSLNPRLIKRILHPNEKQQFLLTSNKALFLAQRWAIKEALYKANNKLVNFSKIEIKKKGRQFIFPGYIITTTKEDDYYLAVVIKERDEHKT